MTENQNRAGAFAPTRLAFLFLLLPQRLTENQKKSLRTTCSPQRRWRCRPDLNWGVRVLQTLALPLGHGTILNLSRKKGTRGAFLQLTNGAGDEARTRYLHLGKVALYQMSYTRIWCLRSELNQRHADFQSAALPTELQRHVEPSKTRLRCFKNGDPERTRTVDLQRDRLAC